MASDLKSLGLPIEEIRTFCARWNVVEFAIFGSALHEDFGPESDIDVMVEFSGSSRWGLFDHVEMKLELERILSREVDLVTRTGLERSHNWIRKEAILGTAQILELHEEK